MSAPFNARFDNGAFRPMGRYAAECAATFRDGDIVRLECVESRSWKSHSHQFAWIAEAWRQLPEDIADDYPTPEHLRKRALVQAGYFNETALDCGTAAAAQRVAAEVRRRSEFSLVILRGPFVIIRDPMSQSLRAMGGKTFQESKTAILNIIADLIGVAPETLTRETGKAA